ncbi:hypothetical protein [Ktedonospora formicarum]|uniref:Uncharacterized protein n=1 Tax=Ktedonospora formicarum TaxID=2778364 RepID=A0A8J3I907_9CHLR|nr:hypothetical protein [Ktedonospora formicarum]GHO50856.1 hypothetical protein KSX_90190 [Ktedonospora formicarum]
MSHIVEAKTKIVCPNLPEFLALIRQGDDMTIAELPFILLLRQAVTMVASEYEGELKPYYLDYYQIQHRVNTGLALHIPRQAGKQALDRGLGLSIDEKTGVLTCVGDPYRVEEFYEAIQRRIIRTYTTLAYMAAMRLEQFQHVSVQALQEGVVISGELYA